MQMESNKQQIFSQTNLITNLNIYNFFSYSLFGQNLG